MFDLLESPLVGTIMIDNGLGAAPFVSTVLLVAAIST